MTRQPVMDAAELQDFMDEVFPQQRGRFRVEEIAPMAARLRFPVAYENLRPGGTVSGPTMFTAADCSFYAAVLAMIGREALAVTTNLNINFLTKPPVADLIAHARILRLGRTLAAGDVLIMSEGVETPVAHAAVTYAIPPNRQKASEDWGDRKACPECGHIFLGNGWDGIDAHWRSKHEDVMPYEEAWPLLQSGTYRRRG